MLKDILILKKTLKENKKVIKNKGFTIVELIVVMAIIAILILIAVPTFTKYMEKADKTREVANASTIYKSTVASIFEDYALPDGQRSLIRPLLEFPEYQNVSAGRYNMQGEILEGVNGVLPVTNRSRGVLIFGYDNNWGPLWNNNVNSSWYQNTWRVFVRVPDSKPADMTAGHVIPTADIYMLSPTNNWYFNGKPYFPAPGQRW